MNRDLIVIPSAETQKIIIATDCSGACGPKDLDVVAVPTVLTSYYTARVAFMEIMSVRATPIAYTISNFIKGGYDDIHSGIRQLTDELNLHPLANITSSETNFDMLQSAVGISVIGTMRGEIDDNAEGLSLAIVGLPLVGDEMLQNLDDVLQMNTFTHLLCDIRVQKLLPVGSKGIANKIKKVFGIDTTSTEIDLKKSAGPSSCLVIGYSKNDENYFADKLGTLFHPIETL